MNEYPTLLNLSNIPTSTPGQPPFCMVARRGIEQLERPSIATPSTSRDAFALVGTGLWGFFKQPSQGGNKVWIIASWLFRSNDTNPSTHLQRLLETDELNPLEPWTVDWISPCKLQIIWGLKECRFLAARINKTNVALLTEGGYDWALPLLAPRRLPGAVRKDASLIQVWGAL